MALSRDALRPARGNGQLDRLPIATNSTIYVGSLVARRNTTGRALAATAATGRRIAGVAFDFEGPNANGVGNTAGTEYVRVKYLDEHLVTIRTAIRTNTALGLNVFVADDEVVAGVGVGTAALRVAVGELVRFEASNKSTGWVAVRRFATTNIAI